MYIKTRYIVVLILLPVTLILFALGYLLSCYQNQKKLYQLIDDGNSSGIRQLLKSSRIIGINSSAGKENNLTPLGYSLVMYHVTQDENTLDAIRALLEYGANPNQVIFPNDKERIDYPIHGVLGFYEPTKLLLDFGADPNTYSGMEGMLTTPMGTLTEFACIVRDEKELENYKRIILLLLSYNANIDLGFRDLEDNVNYSPLMYLCYTPACRLDLVEFLVEQGADVNLKFENEINSYELFEAVKKYRPKKDVRKVQEISELLKSKLKDPVEK